MSGELDNKLTALRAEGCSIMDAIKIARDEFGLNLGEAKKYVATHPAWRDIHEAHQPLHDKLERFANRIAKPS